MRPAHEFFLPGFVKLYVVTVQLMQIYFK